MPYLPILFKSLGVLGLLCITAGVLSSNKIKQDIFFIVGGVLLEAYSIYLRDWVFIILQLVFVAASVYGLEVALRKGTWKERFLHFFHVTD